MIGKGVSILDVTLLVKAIGDKDLIFQVKILDGEWADFDRVQLKKILQAVTSGSITSSADIRARLFAKNSVKQSQRF